MTEYPELQKEATNARIGADRMSLGLGCIPHKIRGDLEEVQRLHKALDAASGYMLNAKIDLETGCPKRTAITTIEGGLKMIRAALAGVD